MNSVVRRLDLVEHKPLELPAGMLSIEEARSIVEKAQGKVKVQPPSGLASDSWVLTSTGWVGHLPVTPELSVVIQPKVPVANLFSMVEVAYRLDRKLTGLEFPYGRPISCETVDDLFDRLARILANGTLFRLKRGLHREYLSREEDLPFVRGSLDIRPLVRKGVTAAIRCRFQELTPDVADNQILLWTLRRITRSAFTTDETRAAVRQAVRAMGGAVAVEPFRGADCRDRFYSRLNLDYEPLHGLCRFFLDGEGPACAVGEETMVPFLVDMDRLFERFVAEWLTDALETLAPGRFSISRQVGKEIDSERRVCATMDILIRDRRTGRAVAVLDTKYKNTDTPDTGDIYQVNAYADLIGTKNAFLVYPNTRPAGYRATLGGTRVLALAFDLGGDLEQAGRLLVDDLLKEIKNR